MNSAIFDGVITALKANATLVALLTSNTRITAPNNLGTSSYPHIDLKGEDLLGEKRVGYRYHSEREQEGMITVDIYVKTTWKDADEIAAQVSKTLVSDTVASTWGWKKISESNIWEEDTKIYKKTIRFNFNYLITDS
jgi:hypothetical protein